MLTLWEVKQNVEKTSKECKVPTAKYLQENGKTVACMRMSMETEIKVYQCGYAVYRIGKYVTVFPIHTCGDYLYPLCEGILCIEESFFDDQEWYVRLILEGEDRVRHNRELQEQEKSISYSAVSEEWNLLRNMEQSPLEQLIVKESIDEIMEVLTERQRWILVQFFFCRKTQKEIAKELGVVPPVISKTISNSIRQIRKKYTDIPSKKTASSVQAEKGGGVHAW